jgi:amino acid adenylation domain-containing protein/thioester reductase-like protein
MSHLLSDHLNGHNDQAPIAAGATINTLSFRVECQLPHDYRNTADIFPQPVARTADLDDSLVGALRVLSHNDSSDLGNVALAAFLILLARYTSAPALTVVPASSSSGQTDGAAPIIPTAPTAFTIDLADNPRFVDLLTRISTYLSRSSESASGSASPNSPSDTRTFFHYRHLAEGQKLSLYPLSLQSSSDLGLCVTNTGKSVQIAWIYNPGYFAAASIARLDQQFQALLHAIVADPQKPINQLSLLDGVEKWYLLSNWNDTATDYPTEICIHELFEAQAARTPTAIALVCEDQQITYRTLNRRANQLARRLQALGAGPDVMVGLAMDRSPEQIVGVLGILKAGAAYVPLDPSYPEERLALILNETRAPVLLTQRHIRDRLPVAHTAHIICVDEEPDTSAEDDHNPPNGATADNLAYVIYTSGSTGTPKGVLIEHRGLVNHTFAMVEHHALDAHDRVLQFSGLEFDASAATLFPALSVGATLVLPTIAPTQLVGDQLTQLCERQQINILQLPASIWHQWVDDLWLRHQVLQAPLKVLLVGGEKPSADKLRRWAKLTGRAMKFLNAYGPTEATITTTLFELSCNEATAETITAIPIGRPLANTQVYILDTDMQPVPVGVAGELYIGGVGLARGYLNYPELTTERFVANPFPTLEHSNTPAVQRLYKTGDLARYRADGNIEFLGRIDHQVKVRGYRIELGEIETVLRQHPAIRDAIVLAREDVPDVSQLVAYIVVDSQTSLDLANDQSFANHGLYAELNKLLREKLPHYMIPAAFVPLAALPLTSNGKLDRQALPAPDAHTLMHEPSARPHTPEEIILANIWSQVLGWPHIGANDNFFALGGHSLAAARVVALASTVFERALPLQMLYEAPTVAAFAQAMHDQSSIPLAPKPDELLADVVLDPAITPRTPWQPDTASPQAIFLTGATGYLGAFLLQELLERTNARIYCLIRAEDAQHAMLRLQQTFTRYSIDPGNWQSRVFPVLGDLGQPLLGIDPQAFQHLAGMIDVIYHTAAQVHYLHPYAALKPANVQGTVEVLRLACLEKVKPVHYVSTLAVAVAAGHEGLVREDEELSICTSVKGYDQSKWVAEAILKIARARGLPVAIYRPGRIGSHSHSGASNSDDFFVRLVAGCLQLGAAPDIPLVENLLPVDVAAHMITRLSQQPALANTTFHLRSPHPTDWRWVIETLQSLGYPVRLVSYQEWHRTLLDIVLADPGHILHSLLNYFPQDLEDADWIDVLNRYRFDIQNTMAGIAGSAIQIPAFDAALVERMIVDIIRQELITEPACYTHAFELSARVLSPV